MSELSGKTVFGMIVKDRAHEDIGDKDSLVGYNLNIFFDVYVTDYGRIRTTCYGSISTSLKVPYPLSVSATQKIIVSGIAFLSKSNPHEFDVVVGIKKSFGRAIEAYLNDPKVLFLYNCREHRKFFWDILDEQLENNFSKTGSGHHHGVWTVENSRKIFNDEVECLKDYAVSMHLYYKTLKKRRGNAR